VVLDEAEEAARQLGARPGLGLASLADDDPFEAFRRARSTQYRARMLSQKQPPAE
jgi:hypothetical protein